MSPAPIGTAPASRRAVKGREDRPKAGILLMCAAVLCFTSIDSSAKWLILSGFPAMQVVFARYAGHFLGSLMIFLPKEGLSAFRSSNPRLQFLRSLLLLGSTAFNFMALAYLPITLTTTIFFTAPIFVSLLSIPLLGEKVGLRRLTAVTVGFLGVLIVIQPWGAEFHPAIFLSLGAMTCASLYFILTRHLAGSENNSTSQLWSSGLAAMIFLPIAVSDWVMPENIVSYVVLILIGFFGGLGHSLATVAHRLANASILAPIVYLQMLFATIASIILFNTLPTIWTFVGATVIIGSGIYIWARERQLKIKNRTETTVRS
jgi:drug/metabolite transporter (DMT)-like permease